MDLVRTASVLSISLLLTACGGGGGGGSSDTDDRGQTAPSFRLSGQLNASANIDHDWDINDPNAEYRNNAITPQAIRPIGIVHGFASQQGTGNRGDRFANRGDIQDFYSVELRQGQSIQLQIVDWENYDLDNTNGGDLDLFLYDSEYEIVGSSYSESEFENITIDEDGQYFILVQAYSGISKYILSLNPVSLSSTQQGDSGNRHDFVANELIVQYQNNQALASSRSALSAKSRGTVFSHGNSTRPVKISLPTLQARSQISSAKGFMGRLQASNPESYQKVQTLTAIKDLQQQSDVLYAEPNYIVQAYSTPNDGGYPFQWHYPQINLPQAWDITTGATNGEPVIVSVIDTGVYLDHEDFSGQLVQGYDFISDPSIALDGDGIDNNPDDIGDSTERGQSSWHGTHVAGTIAAQTNNETGVSGVSWHAKIMPIRVLGFGGGTNYDIMQGILYSAGLANDSGTVPEQKADVINMSLGGGSFSQAAQDVITQARNAGTIIVAAAGNSNTSAPAYPASYSGVISVSATDINNNLTPYSNFGAFIDLAAPGGDITADRNGDGYADGVLSPVANDTSGTRTSAYSFYQGTSMAAPHVAGVFALMKAVHPDLTPSDLDSIIASGVISNDIGNAGRDNDYGYGLIDAFKAVNEAQRLAAGGSAPDPIAEVIVNPTNLALGIASTGTLIIEKRGDVPASISSITDNATWLTVSPTNIDTDNFGSYRVQIDRTDLASGYYQAEVSINIDDGRTINVFVSMQINIIGSEGALTQPYVVIANAESLETVAGARAIKNGATWEYQISGVPAGSYVLIAGSDVDNDDNICDAGETCGAYPSITGFEAIEVSEDISDIDIVLDLGDISVNASNNSDSKEKPRAFQRID